jgi:hypothetical protein
MRGRGGGSIRMDCRIREVFLLSIDIITPQVTVTGIHIIIDRQVEKTKVIQQSELQNFIHCCGIVCVV